MLPDLLQGLVLVTSEINRLGRSKLGSAIPRNFEKQDSLSGSWSALYHTQSAQSRSKNAVGVLRVFVFRGPENTANLAGFDCSKSTV